MSKKVLIISYYWPPAGGPGVQRILKTCKFLLDYNWTPVVLTTKDGTYSSIDSSLEADIPKGIKVYRVKPKEYFHLYNNLTGRKKENVSVGLINMNKKKSVIEKLALFVRANFFVPDGRIGWNKPLLKKAITVIEKEKIDIILTSGPPHSTHLVGLALKKHFQIPWVADFRDPWTTVFYNKDLPRTSFTKRRDKKLEQLVLKNADLVTVVSQGLKNELKNKTQTVEIIFNGYDNEDIPSTNLITEKKFNITYTGNFKPNQNVSCLWSAINELKNELKNFEQNFCIQLIGNTDHSIIESINQNGLKNYLKLIPYVSHKEATQFMFDSNLLLFIIPKTTNNELIITGKLFEYLASRTPLLAIGPEQGDANTIIQKTNRGCVIDYKNQKKIKSVIASHYKQWIENNKTLIKLPESKNIDSYSRREQTQKLSKLLERLLS